MKDREPTIDYVQEVLAAKAWYGLDPETGAFDWNASIENIAASLGLETNTDPVKLAFENGFTPQALSTVKIESESLEGNSGTKEVSLLGALDSLGVEKYLWTVGDQDWQRTKIERTGAMKYFDEEHYSCVPYNKLRELENLVETIQARAGEKITHVVVVDDKSDHTDYAKKLAGHVTTDTFSVGDFHMKLDDPWANAQAFYEFVKEYQELYPDHHVVTILDFDGVIADTNQVLFGPVARNLAALL